MEVQTTPEQCPICGTEVDMPVDTIEAIARAPGQIGEAVRTSLGSRLGWSPAEVLTHLADTEVVTGWRLRQILAEDEPTLQPYDQERWAAALKYHQRDSTLALETFAVARQANLEILRLLSDDEWQRTYIQPEYGRQTLRNKIRHISDHDLAHLRQIRGE
ncbi:MAG TPA: DinB family protein [Dehalococcoidia bacterium]|nr:DinB family protein [Dehalococcoidia bacterium]